MADKFAVYSDTADNVVTQAQVSGLGASLAAKANDADVVHDTGNESVAGVKTFTSAPVVPAPAAVGNPVRTDVYGEVTTVDATVTTLATRTVSDGFTELLEFDVVARSDASQGAGYKIYGCFRRDAGVVTQIGVTSLAVTFEDNVLWNATLDISGTDVRVRVTGAIAANITWKALGRVTQISAPA